MIPLAEEAAEEIDADIEIIDVRTIQPNDYDEIVESVEKTGRAAILHEDSKSSGMGGEIASKIQEEAILHMEAPVERITAPDVPYPLYTLEDDYMPDKEQVVDGINKVLEF
jgi:pyruvate/2-oxoglutarate/acetoin dehydrogenase E1 component